MIMRIKVGIVGSRSYTDKKKIKERMFFPGYILISLEMDNEVKYFIENSTSVMSFVGPKGQIPVPLRENEVKFRY